MLDVPFWTSRIEHPETRIKHQEMSANYSIILLAAGSSSRLGQPKQLVEHEGVPLLLKATLTALDAKYGRVTVVLGADADVHKKLIAHLPVEIITNQEWEKGMGSSMKAGLRHVLKSRPETDAVLVMVCDQPLLASAHLVSLIALYEKTSSPMVASRYEKTNGVPALFHRSIFNKLLEIKDQQGAKVIIESHANTIELIDWEEGRFDIDTPEDLEKLNYR